MSKDTKTKTERGHVADAFNVCRRVIPAAHKRVSQAITDCDESVGALANMEALAEASEDFASLTRSASKLLAAYGALDGPEWRDRADEAFKNMNLGNKDQN